MTQAGGSQGELHKEGKSLSGPGREADQSSLHIHIHIYMYVYT